MRSEFLTRVLYPILMYLLIATTLLAVLDPYLRSLTIRRLNCIILPWLEHIDTAGTISELNARVSSNPDMGAYGEADCPL